MPKFTELQQSSSAELRSAIAHRVRVERRLLGKTQKEFAEHCGIALRTYKRFELGECDSLEVFVRIVIAFQRVVGIELLFPAKAAEILPRDALAKFNQFQARLKESQ